MFDWCFRRVLAGYPADLIEIKDGGRLVAGSAVTYRNVSVGSGTVRAGILTGSFTLPHARGKGHFTHVVEQSLSLVETRDCAMLLGFVTADNASAKGLRGAGATMVPTYYCRRRTAGSSRITFRRAADAARFAYTPEEWHSQFLRRPEPAELIDGGDHRAVIDKSGRLQYFDGDDRRTEDLDIRFFYTTEPGGIPDAFEVIPGFLGILGKERPTSWTIHNGDRM